jgi:hypothetical protein
LTRATGDCFFARAGARRLGAALRFFVALFRAPARMLRLLVAPRFRADRADFFFAADFLAFVAMDHLL